MVSSYKKDNDVESFKETVTIYKQEFADSSNPGANTWNKNKPSKVGQKILKTVFG